MTLIGKPVWQEAIEDYINRIKQECEDKIKKERETLTSEWSLVNTQISKEAARLREELAEAKELTCSQVRETKEECKILRVVLSESEKKCESLRDERDRLERIVDSADGGIHELREKLKDVSLTRDRFEQELAKSEKLRDQEHRTVVELQKAHFACTRECVRIQQELEQIAQIASERQGMYDKLAVQLQASDSQNVELRAECARLRQENDKCQDLRKRLKGMYDLLVVQLQAAIKERDQFRFELNAKNTVEEQKLREDVIARAQHLHPEVVEAHNGTFRIMAKPPFDTNKAMLDKIREILEDFLRTKNHNLMWETVERCINALK